MRVVLIGADSEENLGMGMIAASLSAARHRVQIVAFTEMERLDAAVAEALSQRPELVGLAMQFQHRGWGVAALAERLRQAGFRGHMTAGGQFASMAHEPLLRDTPSLDSVVLYDGEETIVDLAEAIRGKLPIAEIAGLAVRLDDGCVHRTPARPMPQDLDRLPMPQRYRTASRHFGVPFVPISGGRGCWGKCAFCSITSLYRDARRAAGGVGFRLRTPRSIAREMAELTRREQSPCIFCFHDETWLLPRAADTLNRVSELESELDHLGVTGYGLIGKCRPDCITEELAAKLAERHVIRLYVGIENASQAGQDHLARRTRTEQLGRALTAINRAGIFGCYNLLIFEPETTLGDVRENIAFMREYAENPVNFCRAEPYHGTPLWQQLDAQGKLEGSWLGWDYHLQDPLAELLFRVTSVVFRQRNYDCYGVANRAMSIGYMAKVLAHFHAGSPAQVAHFAARAKALTRQITLDTAEQLEQCVELVERFGLERRDRIERGTARLGLLVAARDAKLHTLIDQFIADAEGYASEQRATRRVQLPARLTEALTGLALAGCVATTSPGCGGESEDPAPGINAGASAGGRGGTTTASGGMVYDALPSGGGRLGFGGSADPVVYSGGRGGTTTASGGMVYDALPSGGGRGGTTTASGGMVSDALPSTGGRGGTTSTASGGSDPLVSSGGRVVASGGYAGTAGRGGATKGGAGGTAGTGGRGGTTSYGVGAGGGDSVAPSGGRTIATGGYTGVGALPGTGGRGVGGMVYDALPSGGGRGGATTANGGTTSDPLPSTGGRSDTGGAAGIAGRAGTPGTVASNAINVGHFRDTRSRRTIRNSTLALHDPPEVTLQAVRQGDEVRVGIVGVTEAANTRWESRGKVTGQGLEVCWCPDDPDDQLRVAIRTHGGVTVAAIRAKDLPG
jgi:anaerobic magnesium-protoporphyrin IX monomethyl ester cyclase